MIHNHYDPEVLRRVQEAEYELLGAFLKICADNGIETFAVFGTAIGAARHGGFIPWDDDLDMAMLRPDYERLVSVMEAHPDWGYGIAGPGCTQGYYNLLGKFYRKGTVFQTEYAHGTYPMGINLDIFIYDEVPVEEDARRAQLRHAKTLSRLNMVQNVNMLTRAMSKTAANLVPRLMAGAAHGLLQVLPRRHFERAYEKNARMGEGSGSGVFEQFNDPWLLEGAMAASEIFPVVPMAFGPVEVPMPRGYDAVLRRQYGDYLELPPEESRRNHHPYLLKFEDGGALYGSSVGSAEGNA